jgi:hypothetical protein
MRTRRQRLLLGQGGTRVSIPASKLALNIEKSVLVSIVAEDGAERVQLSKILLIPLSLRPLTLISCWNL